MNKSELDKKHPDYIKNIDSWKFYKAAYDGTKSLLDYGIVKKLSDESTPDYKDRLKTIFGFNLSNRLIDIIISYLFSKPTDYDFQALENDKLFQMFFSNANKQGCALEEWSQEQATTSKIYGHTGILVNRGKVQGDRTVDQDVKDRLYAYVSSFAPPAIYDWTYELINGEKVLTFIKLIDEVGDYNLWWSDRWEIWGSDGKRGYKLKDKGKNDLGEIPFVILRNGGCSDSMGGTSDIKEIARHDSTLINVAHGANEIIQYNAFPMLQIPEPRDKDKKILVDARAVLYKSSKDPGIKAEWLTTAVSEPIGAIIDWSKVIVLEAYKALSASFMNDNGGGVESGEAKKRAFQSFNASLAKSSIQLESAETEIIRLWLKWQDKEDLINSVSVSRAKQFDVQSLLDDIDVFSAASMIVKSATFSKHIQKSVVSKVLPDLPADAVKVINKEIDAEKPSFDANSQDKAAEELES